MAEKKKKNRKTNSKTGCEGKAKAADVIDSDEVNVSLFDSWPAYVNDFHVLPSLHTTLLRQDLVKRRACCTYAAGTTSH